MYRGPVFYNDFMNGEASFHDIYGYIERWYNENVLFLPLLEYLGLTEEQYKLFLESPYELEKQLEEKRDV